MIYLLPEIIAFVTAGLLGATLTFRASRFQFFREAAFIFGMMAAALSVLLLDSSTEALKFGLLEINGLFRLPRAMLFLCSCILSRTVAGTKHIPAGRKPETLFLLTVSVLLCDVLLLSKNLALSCVLLVIFSWIGTFFSGMGFRGKREGEALLKHWVQGSIAIVIASGGLVVVSAIAGGVSYEQIALYVSSLAEYSPIRVFMIFILYLPFLMVAGLFPFHMAHVDRDEGAPWAIQSILSVMGCGAAVLALWGMAARVFTTPILGAVPDGLRCLQFCGLLGGVWLAFFALGQKNSKRLFSGFIGGAWSVLLVSGSLHSPMAAASIVYGVCAVLLWGSLLSYVWANLQEHVGSEMVVAIFGAGRVYRGRGLLLLFSLASPMFLPAFPGFTGVILQLASVIEQKSLLLLVFFSILLILFTVLASKLAADLLFRRVSEALSLKSADDFARYGMLDLLPLAALIFAMLWLGIMGNSIFGALHESAKPFLN